MPASAYARGFSIASSRSCGRRGPDGASTSGSEVWGIVDLDDNREYAIFGHRNGTAFYEVTNPANPRLVANIPGNPSLWREVKAYQVFDAALGRHRAYAYATTEAAGGGLQVFDLTDLPNTVTLANTLTQFSSSHTLYISNINYATNAALPGATVTVMSRNSTLSPRMLLNAAVAVSDSSSCPEISRRP